MKKKIIKELLCKTYPVKFLNIFRFLIYNLINIIISFQKQTKTPHSLLIIRLDSIGDYVLVRNYFQALKKSKKYKDYNFTLCGNIVWKELAETLDSSTFDNFIWLDRKKFNNNIFYQYRILKNVYSNGFEITIDTTFSREILFGDVIVKTSKAIHRIGSKGAPDSYVQWKRNLLTDKYYTQLITQSSENLFEFYRNREFFENISNEIINLSSPKIQHKNISILLPTPKDFIVVFPGAKEEKRKWAYEKYACVIKRILTLKDFDIVIAGSDKDSIVASSLSQTISSNRIFDMTGKSTLSQLAKLISLCRVLISNETSAVHIAAAVSTPFVCISNGNHFGRFNPYPLQMKIKSRYVYPEQIEKELDNFEKLSSKYRFESSLDINSISPDQVYKAFEELL